jgi:hypothetical protein
MGRADLAALPRCFGPRAARTVVRPRDCISARVRGTDALSARAPGSAHAYWKAIGSTPGSFHVEIAGFPSRRL